VIPLSDRLLLIPQRLSFGNDAAALSSPRREQSYEEALASLEQGHDPGAVPGPLGAYNSPR